MLTTLDQIVERLVQGYDPDRIILFGSHAIGTSREDSDIDLLVVKDTVDRPLERRIQVERLLSDRSTPLDIQVYTPQEMRVLFSIGDPFIEEIVEKGKVVYMRSATTAWVREAHDEFDTASILSSHEKRRGVCLHSQQAVEKGLKALLLEKGERPPRTHDILELINRVKAGGWPIQLDVEDAVFLNSIYRGRYPTDEGLLPHGEPTAEDAQRALGAAGNVIASIDRLLTTVQPQPDEGDLTAENTEESENPQQ